MSKKASVTILGCGNSTGVPALFNNWGACDPSESKNRRTRCSIAVQTDETTLIIDTGVDFSTQINRENISCIDGVFYTHSHADHVNGIDELRQVYFRNKDLLPIFSNHDTLSSLSKSFSYMFDGSHDAAYPKILAPHEITEANLGHLARFRDINYIPFNQNHGSVDTLGFRFGDLGYSVDMLNLDDDAISILTGVRTWIVDCAAYKHENKMHAHLDRIFNLNARIGAEQVYLSSLSIAMDYQTLCDELQNGYAPAYDGMKLECNL